jgi:hypothetical protein
MYSSVTGTFWSGDTLVRRVANVMFHVECNLKLTRINILYIVGRLTKSFYLYRKVCIAMSSVSRVDFPKIFHRKFK